MGYVDILKLCLLHAFYEIKILKPWKLIQTWIQFAYAPFSLGCKPLIKFKQGKKTLDEIASVNCQEQNVEGGILTTQVLEKELFIANYKNQCWSLVMTPNTKGEIFCNQVEVANVNSKSNIISTHENWNNGEFRWHLTLVMNLLGVKNN